MSIKKTWSFICDKCGGELTLGFGTLPKGWLRIFRGVGANMQPTIYHFCSSQCALNWLQEE